ncbi:hypothetical protein JCM18920_248 [Cutibacterium acnes JCM 18920]|nr:hypothetical protein JCM18920_248 [Cutibacterium acnes JCM 18920]
MKLTTEERAHLNNSFMLSFSDGPAKTILALDDGRQAAIPSSRVEVNPTWAYIYGGVIVKGTLDRIRANRYHTSGYTRGSRKATSLKPSTMSTAKASIHSYSPTTWNRNLLRCRSLGGRCALPSSSSQRVSPPAFPRHWDTLHEIRAGSYSP